MSDVTAQPVVALEVFGADGGGRGEGRGPAWATASAQRVPDDPRPGGDLAGARSAIADVATA